MGRGRAGHRTPRRNGERARGGAPGEIQMHGLKLSEIGKNVRNELNRYKRAIKGRN